MANTRSGAEQSPDVDAQVDELLSRLECGETRGLSEKFHALLREHPEHHMTNYGMGVYVAVGRQDPVGATAFFEQAVRALPEFAEALYNLANSYLKAGRVRQAVLALRQALRHLEPNDQLRDLVREKLIEVEEIVVQGNSGYTTLDGYIENEKLFDEAFEHLRNQRFEQSIELFRRVLEQCPTHVQSYGNMALAQASLGRKAAALACLDKALSLDPSYEPARNNRRVIEKMKPGVPFIPPYFAEMEYYRERLEAEKQGRRRWLDKISLWRSR